MTRRELSNDEFCPRWQSQYETLRREEQIWCRPNACHEFDPVVVLRIRPDITWDSCIQQRIKTVLNHGDRGMVICDVAAIQCPTLGTLDVLARLLLSVRRRGWHLTVRGAQSELRALLALAGLVEVLGVTSNSPRGPAAAG